MQRERREGIYIERGNIYIYREREKTSETVFVLKQRLYFKRIFPNIPDE